MSMGWCKFQRSNTLHRCVTIFQFTKQQTIGRLKKIKTPNHVGSVFFINLETPVKMSGHLWNLLKFSMQKMFDLTPPHLEVPEWWEAVGTSWESPKYIYMTSRVVASPKREGPNLGEDVFFNWVPYSGAGLLREINAYIYIYICYKMWHVNIYIYMFLYVYNMTCILCHIYWVIFKSSIILNVSPRGSNCKTKVGIQFRPKKRCWSCLSGGIHHKYTFIANVQ